MGSYYDEFYSALEGLEKNKKKKKKETIFTSTGYPRLTLPTNSESSFTLKSQEKLKQDVSKKEKETDDDIAPVKRTWFDTSAFDDGFQWSDIPKVIGGTATDIGENLSAGFLGIGERLVDAGMMLGATMNRQSMSQAAQSEMLYNAIAGNDVSAKDTLSYYQQAQDKVEEETAKFVAKDLYDEEEIAKKIILGTDKNSLLGEKSDSLLQSGGQLLGQVGVSLIPGVGQAGGMALMGATAFGSEAESALNQDADFNEAMLSGAISAGAEILTEKLGGISFGGKTVTDAIFNKMSSKMTNKLTTLLVKSGKVTADALSEAAEEILSGYLSAAGQQMTYMEDYEIEELFSNEDKLESFIGGLVLGGAGGTVEAVAKGKGYVTGLKRSEQKVVDKIFDDAIAEKEANGKKLTTKEKNELYDTIVGNLETGQIEIDDIESILGGDEYKAYKETVDSEEALKKELAELRGMKSGDMTDIQTTRMNELKGMNLEDTTKRDSLRAKLDETLSPMLKNSKLNESYNERAKKGQAFEADLSQYTGKQRESVERAIKSGVLNNTFKSHQLVETLSRMEADKGITFDYADNAKLEELGYSLEGKTINGFEKNGTVTLNVQSAKAWQSVVGHEITHILEGTDSYTHLQEALFKYAESKGELESRRANLTELYKNVKDANIDAELTADLVGDYLFSDKNFINKLTGNRTLFQKIRDEVNYLYKIATGKEKTEIEKVKEEFDKAWKELNLNESIENEATDAEIDDVNYSVSVTDKATLDSLNNQVAKGEYNAETNPEGGYYVTYKSMSYWGTDEDGNAILRSPMAEYVDGELSNAYLIPKDKSKLNWYQATETIDEKTGLPAGLMVKVKKPGNKSFTYLPAAENQDLIKEDWSNLYFNLQKKVLKNGKWVNSDVPARYNPYEHSSNSMLNDQFSAAYLRDNLVTVKMYVPVSEDNGAFRAQYSKDPTGWAEWKTGTVAGKINKQKDLQRKVYLSRYAAPVEIVSDAEVAQAYKEYLDGTDVTIPDNVVPPNLLKELKNAGVPIAESGKVKYSVSAEPIISKLTEREISEQAYATLDRLQRGDAVAIEELNSLPEVIEGEEKVKEYTAKFLEEHPELKDVPASELGTHLIDSAEREQMRNDILQDRLKSGSFTGVDSKKKEVYNGSVEKGKRLDIVIGLAAAGKSTSLVNPLSQYYKSVVVDSDIIKGKLPEFNEGWGASLVHEESSKINMRMLIAELAQGNNIVLPIVGAKVSSVETYLNLAKRQGYEVHLHLNELNSSKAMGRMLKRYFTDGRFIPPEVSWKNGDKPTSVYEEMKNRGDINGYSHWNNDVPKGQRPTLTEADGSNEAFSTFSGTWRAVRAEDVGRGNSEIRQGTSEDFGNGVGGLQMGVVEDAPTRENSEGSTGLSEVVRLSLSPKKLSPKTQEALNRSGVVSLELVDSTNDSNAFSISLSEARTADKQNGWAVTPKTAKELVENNVRTIMTTDSKAGLGVAPDGDIEAVFKNPNGGKPRVLDTLIPAALEMGGNKLDCYGEGLVDLYARYGFVPVARVEFNEVYANEGWTPDKGTPYIFFMYHNGDSADTVAANKGTYKKWTTEELNALPLYGKEDYGPAYAYRDSFLPENIAPVKDSLSFASEQFAPIGNYSTPLNETYLAPTEDIAPVKETVEDIPMPTDADAPFPDEIAPMTEEEANAVQDAKANADAKAEGNPKTRKQLHSNIINDIKATFSSGGFDFDDALSKAKDLSTFSTVDNTPQRVMEKALGYKEGQVLADLTVNKVAQNETKGIKWLNSFTDRKNGLLAKISKQYNIKPGSKESAAAQMYAEGFYVTDTDDIVEYGDAELAQDFPDAQVQRNIKGLASDPRIRQIYDETLEAINASRARNAYPEIQKLDNYFLHFRAMEDTFSKLGLPFNPNDIRAKDLPTDLNGVTADLKPGQPYFASSMHRKGKRTSFDLLGGLERYLTSAKNQIYHIDDIQTLRALRNYIADTYGQANGLEGIDMLTEEEAQEKIEKVYGSHLSTFAKFLNEEANILAGKTALIDRGLEGVIGRRGMTFLDTVRKQTGVNMVGYNISSSLTNFIPVAQTIAKTNKFDFLKAFTQTVSNKLGSIVGKGDSFAENSPVMIRRKGADRFYRTPFQKAGDTGYAFMGVVDNISTELIARTKFNELTRKGMSEQQAHFETDKWVSRLMGDRSLGQMPQLFNSKTLGFITQFQLEVRNQLDSQFYDTIQEAKVSNEEIENGLARNAKTAAKVASTFVQLAVAQHLFGKAFESVAGYNPAFDIISTLATMFGFDDEEESEDTALDNLEQGFLELLEDLPYTSTLTGGRIPMASALPITEFIKGVDSYGNEKSRLETLGEVAPYYILPGGYGQIKKTTQGLNMFSDEHPVSGSYTDSGNLRFPVEDTFANRLQAGIFGQYASENAREYFDNGYAPLKEKQIQEYIDVELPIADYWDYREGLKGLKTNAEKADYINNLDIADWQKNLLMNNILDRKEDVDMSNYDDFANYEEFDWATKNPEKYEFFTSNGISYKDYVNADDDGKDAYNWAYNNPEGYALSKAVTDDVITYRSYTKDLNDIKADKDANGKSISGSRKEKVINYLNNLDVPYETKIILLKSEYPAEDSYNGEIINYLNGRDDLTYEERTTIFTELGFTVKDGYVYWD